MSGGLLISHIAGLVQVRPVAPGIVAGADMAHLPVINHAWILVKDGRIHSFGSMDTCPDSTGHECIDASGRWVMPTFVDSHTHLVFPTPRSEEFVMKIRGATYAEIAANGGGILNSARKLQGMSEDDLLEVTLPRIKALIASGTGAFEIKSGYGLTVADELKMLRVARRLARHVPVTIRTTLLGAHAIPTGMSKDHYVRLVIEEMIPAAAAEGLADYVDVFCEEGFFSPADTEAIIMAGRRHGLGARIHANQLHHSGGVQVGVKTGAISVDHLEQMGDEEIACLREGNTMPVVLPGAAFFLNLPFPPARRMIESGLPVAIASDYNPGSSPAGTIPMMISLACIRMRLTPEEAINATTINTAHTLGLTQTHGTITVGKEANLLITRKVASLAELPYAYDTPWADTVLLRGVTHN